jgi:hypothetical protein
LGVIEGVRVWVGVGVLKAIVGVHVGVGVAERVGVLDGVRVTVGVFEGVIVLVGVLLGVLVLVGVFVGVAVAVGVADGKGGGGGSIPVLSQIRKTNDCMRIFMEKKFITI